jgi:protein TonB
MPYRGQSTRQDRTVAIVAVVAVHAAIGALLLIRHPSAGLAPNDPPPLLIDIREPPPPPPPQPDPGKAKEEEGEAGKKDEPTPVVAPKPQIDLPTNPPVPAAPVAGTGNSPNAGNSTAGTGPGAGGSGAGRGGGGTGGGGGPARWISGGLRNSDYPGVALSGRMTGTVRVRFTVLTTGRIANCRVVGSSGSNVLDDVTCRLLTQRLRFRPATDGSGRPIESELGSDYTWGINIRR